MIRKTVLYSGRVQGVGFRYTTARVAADFAVTGTVRNLDDGRVEVVAEGEAAVVDAFLAAVGEKMRGYIKGVKMDGGAASGGFADFRVTH
jgi:acylphosphatase